MVNRITIRGGFQFRHFGKQYFPENKTGLYFGSIWERRKDFDRLGEKEVIELRDWLTRYINTYYLKSVPPSIPDMRAKSRSIIRQLDQLEAGK